MRTVPLEPGAMLGPYRIAGAIGSGGMGSVYEAEDTRLHRSVALKLLRPNAGHAEGMRQRFEREARVIAALNHPHICAVYDVGTHDGADYLVMERVRGETLAARLRRGPLPFNEAITIALQVADALGAAHAKGIVHRDLKPENIMIAPAGAKVLDFGLAKMDPPVVVSDSTVTESRALTTEGTIIGTLAYMAPEQMEGKDCDSRTDVFAFGLVLYEMVTARRAFPQESTAGLIAAVLASHPDFTPIQNLEKPHFERVLRGCVDKEPASRWQNILDVKRLLEWPADAPAAPAARDRSGRWWLRGVAAAGILAGVLGGVAYLRRAPEPVTPLKVPIFLERFGGRGIATPAVSPDGLQLAYLAKDSGGVSSIWVHRLDTNTSAALPGTQGAGAPFWSADGRWIGFHSDGKLNKVRPSGERPQKIADVATLSYGAWGSRGDIIFAAGQRSPLYDVTASGGTPRQITELDTSRTENSHRRPIFLPDGKRFLFTARCGERENNALYLGSLDSGKAVRIAPIQSNVEYLPPAAGRPAEILSVRDGVLVSQEFDGQQLKGEPVTVVDGVRYLPASSLAVFTISSNGRALVYGGAAAGLGVLTWFDRSGRKIGDVGAAGDYTQPRISPDGSHVILSEPDSRTGNRDIWSTDLRTGTSARLTTNPANDWWAVWSPDGKQLLFGSDRQGTVGMKAYVKRTLETGLDESPIDTGSTGWDASPSDWSSTGWMIFNAYVRSGKSDLWVTNATTGKAVPFLQMESNLTGPRFSPDGKWIAYVSDESGKSEVYVRPFHDTRAGGGDKIQVSNGGGDFPAWSRSGSELFFISRDGNLKQFDLRHAGPAAAATTLFHPCSETGLNAGIGAGAIWEHPYDVSPDGRFLFNCLAEPSGRFVVWMNWRAASQR